MVDISKTAALLLFEEPRKKVTTLVLDTFTGPDATPLNLHTPDIDTQGGGWLNPIGVWDIRSNKASVSAGVGGSNGTYIDAGQADAILTLSLNTGDAKYPGLLFRASATNDCILAHLSVVEDRMQVFKNVLGARTEIANVAVTVGPNTEYAIKVTLSGASVKIEVDDVELVDITETHNQVDTGAGLWQWDANLWNDARWDDFTVMPN